MEIVVPMGTISFVLKGPIKKLSMEIMTPIGLNVYRPLETDPKN
jgi:hypothetical protein